MPTRPPPERSALQRGVGRTENRTQPTYRISLDFNKLSGKEIWTVEKWIPREVLGFKLGGWYEPLLQKAVGFKEGIKAVFGSRADAELFLAQHIAGLARPLPVEETSLYFNEFGERVNAVQ